MIPNSPDSLALSPSSKKYNNNNDNNNNINNYTVVNQLQRLQICSVPLTCLQQLPQIVAYHSKKNYVDKQLLPPHHSSALLRLPHIRGSRDHKYLTVANSSTHPIAPYMGQLSISLSIYPSIFLSSWLISLLCSHCRAANPISGWQTKEIWNSILEIHIFSTCMMFERKKTYSPLFLKFLTKFFSNFSPQSNKPIFIY